MSGSRRAGLRRLAALTATLCGLALVACTPSEHRTVTVLGPWIPSEKEQGEQESFQAIIDRFQEQTGILVDYTGTRDADAVLASELGSGKPPDLAVLANPGRLEEYAMAGALVPIEAALDDSQLREQYDEKWLELMRATSPSGAKGYYAILVKAASKSLIWYNPAALPAEYSQLLTPDLTWPELTTMTSELSKGADPWCLGLADSSNSGWPGTDWIEDIVLHQSGPLVYDQWADSQLSWTSPQIKSAWQAWGKLIDVSAARPEEIENWLLTSYREAGWPLFDKPAGCFLEHAASFVTNSYADYESATGVPRPGTDFTFAPFPPSTGSLIVGGDLLGMFRDTPAAREFIAYLTTSEAQAIWTARPGSGAISVNKQVSLDNYPDELSRDLAASLLAASEPRFDASDSMPQVMASAFHHAVLAYLDNPAQLDAILRQLDEVRQPR